MNFERAIREFDDDRDFLMEVLAGFLDIAGGQMTALRAALEGGDAALIAAESHSIKGGAANLTAEDLARAASALETIAKAGDLSAGPPALDDLENEYRRLVSYRDGLMLEQTGANRK
jgi:HPt (histidine-containing phosphotransfer) domain-containing protein